MTDRAPDRRVRDHVDDPVGDTAQVTDARHRPQTHAEREARSPAKTRPITLALQGGGSHGAYTWGVLDRLLEDDRFGVEAVSGTSAGALNGAALVAGFATGGRQGACLRRTPDLRIGRLRAEE